MSRIRLLVKIATVAGPTAYNLIKTYGPQVKQIVEENPELLSMLKSKFTRVLGAGREKTGGASLSERVDVLRDQVTYLYASANTAAMAERAAKWRSELDHIEKALPLLNAMSAKAKKTKTQSIEAQLDDLSAHVLAASLEDDVEDAEVVDGD